MSLKFNIDPSSCCYDIQSPDQSSPHVVCTAYKAQLSGLVDKGQSLSDHGERDTVMW